MPQDSLPGEAHPLLCALLGDVLHNIFASPSETHRTFPMAFCIGLSRGYKRDGQSAAKPCDGIRITHVIGRFVLEFCVFIDDDHQRGQPISVL